MWDQLPKQNHYHQLIQFSATHKITTLLHVISTMVSVVMPKILAEATSLTEKEKAFPKALFLKSR